MGIVVTIVAIIALVIIARNALKGYEAEVRKNPNSTTLDASPDPILFGHDSGTSADVSHSHGQHHADPGCVDSHHSGCEVGGHGGFDGGHGGFGGHH